jgi:hypothetical protein
MDFTLEELQHIMAEMNSAWGCYHESIVDCPICSSARKKLEAAIEELQGKPVFKEVPEGYKKLGVLSWEVVKGSQE